MAHRSLLRKVAVDTEAQAPSFDDPVREINDQRRMIDQRLQERRTQTQSGNFEPDGPRVRARLHSWRSCNPDQPDPRALAGGHARPSSIWSLLGAYSWLSARLRDVDADRAAAAQVRIGSGARIGPAPGCGRSEPALGVVLGRYFRQGYLTFALPDVVLLGGTISASSRTSRIRLAS